MAGSAITGRDGDARISATQIAEVTKWTWNPKVNIVEYASNKTAGYKQRLGGIKMGSGTLEGVWDPAIPSYSQGISEGSDPVTLKLYITATQFWSVTGIIESFTMDVNIDAGEMVKWTCSFLSKGLWTAPVAALMMPEPIRSGDIEPTAGGEIFTPGELPLPQKEGESNEAYARRLQEFHASLRMPMNFEEVVRKINERLDRIKSTEHLEEMILRASEKAAIANVDAVADAVLYKLKDRLPPYQPQNASTNAA